MMISEALHVNWQTQSPSAGLGPFGMSKAKASRQSEGIREQETGGSLPRMGQWHSGLTRKLKAPEEPGAVLSMLGSVAGSALSTGCFLLGHQRR